MICSRGSRYGLECTDHFRFNYCSFPTPRPPPPPFFSHTRIHTQITHLNHRVTSPRIHWDEKRRHAGGIDVKDKQRMSLLSSERAPDWWWVFFSRSFSETCLSWWELQRHKYYDFQEARFLHQHNDAPALSHGAMSYNTKKETGRENFGETAIYHLVCLKSPNSIAMIGREDAGIGLISSEKKTYKLRSLTIIERGNFC